MSRLNSICHPNPPLLSHVKRSQVWGIRMGTFSEGEGPVLWATQQAPELPASLFPCRFVTGGKNDMRVKIAGTGLFLSQHLCVCSQISTLALSRSSPAGLCSLAPPLAGGLLPQGDGRQKGNQSIGTWGGEGTPLLVPDHLFLFFPLNPK